MKWFVRVLVITLCLMMLLGVLSLLGRGDVVVRSYVYDRDIGIANPILVPIGGTPDRAFVTIRTSPLRGVIAIAADGDNGARHTHELLWGIQEDNQSPGLIRVFVDGVERTKALGGPFAPLGGWATIHLDVTRYLVGAPDEHSLELRCLSGRGHVEVQVELYETIKLR